MAVFLALYAAAVSPTATLGAEGQAGDASWDEADVICADGQVYEAVTVSWGLEGYSLKLVAGDGSVTVLSPSRVSRIVDRSGADITNQVASASPARDVNFALIGDRRVVPFEFGLMLAAGGSGTVNKGEGSFQTGGAVIAGVRIPFGSLAHGHLLYRHQRIVESEIHSGGTLSAQVDEFHFLYGYRLHFPRENSNYTYIEFGPSLVRFERRYNSDLGVWTDRGATKLGATIQAGLVIPLSASFGFDLGGIMMARPALVEDAGTFGLLAGINAALAWSF